MKRRNFILKSTFAGLGLSTVGAYAYNNLNLEANTIASGILTEPFFKLSLAQWSLNNAIRGGTMDPYNFASKAHELGFEGLEYVNQLYKDVVDSKNQPAALKNFIARNNEKAAAHSLKNLLIMIDKKEIYRLALQLKEKSLSKITING